MFVKSPRSERVVIFRDSQNERILMMYCFLGQYDADRNEIVLSPHAKTIFRPNGNLIIYVDDDQHVSVQLDEGRWEYHLR